MKTKIYGLLILLLLFSCKKEASDSQKTAVASERQAIRDANNAHQAAMEALTTLAELKAFNPKDF